MALIYADVNLSNMQRPELSALQTRALVDSGALHLCIAEHVALQLKLQELEKREVIVADGNKRLVPYVGPLVVKIANRTSLSGAMVLGDEVLLGPSRWRMRTWSCARRCGTSCPIPKIPTSPFRSPKASEAEPPR